MYKNTTNILKYLTILGITNEFPDFPENSHDLATSSAMPRRAAAAVPRQFLRFDSGGTTRQCRDAVPAGYPVRK